MKVSVITFVNTSALLRHGGGGARTGARRSRKPVHEDSGKVLCIMIGEGGSGGALALSVGNEGLDA